MERSPRNFRLPTLDGWRAIAIGLVILGHAWMGFYASFPTAGDLGARIQFADFGVHVFFAISGLLITTLLLREQDEYGDISLAGFYVRRAFRILPPCFLYLAVVVLTVGVSTRWELIGSVLFFRNYIPQTLGSFATAHLWSLAVEEHFYLLWPIAMITVGLRYGARGVAWMSVAFGLWRIADLQNHITDRLFAQVQPHFRTDMCLDALLWGCVAAFLLHGRKQREVFRRRINRAWLAGLGVMGFLCIVFYSPLTGLWIPMLVPILLAGTMLHPEWSFSRMLEHPAVRFVGRISYSLYLWQELFLYPGWQSRSAVQRFPLNLALAFICAIASYRLVEKPCMDFGRALSARMRRSRLERSSSVAPAVLSGL